MKTPILTLAVLTALVLDAEAQARYVTLKIDGANQTNQVAIAGNETFEVVSWPFPYYTTAQINIVKAGTSFVFGPYAYENVGISYAPRPVVMAGPATVELRATAPSSSFCTVRIAPESFPPDKTLIIPANTPGAAVTLECSTDLLNWQTATNGFYTGTNGAKFFRIRADRAP